MVTVVNENTPQIMQDELETQFPSIEKPPRPTSRCHSDDKMAEREEDTSKENPSSETDSDEKKGNKQNAYVVSKTLRHIGSGPRLWYVLHWYWCCKTDDSAKPRHHKVNTSLGRIDPD